jgi:hypothetical protein
MTLYLNPNFAIREVLAPVIVELALWSEERSREFNPLSRRSDELESMQRDNASFIENLKKQYRRTTTGTA